MIKTSIAVAAVLAVLAFSPSVQAETQNAAETPCYELLNTSTYNTTNNYIIDVREMNDITTLDSMTLQFVTDTLANANSFVQCTINDLNP